jgi:4-hydroxybenzoate polyprenyltransferase
LDAGAVPGDLVTALGIRLKNYAELGRISNLPTCVSNALVGTVLGAEGAFPGWGVALSAALGIAFLYTAGMAQNDLFDIEIDRLERPGRPLPSARIAPGRARLFIAVCFALGLGIFALLGREAFLWALGLCVLIWAYNWLHKKHPWSVILMGSCRGFVYLTAAACLSSPLEHPIVFAFAGLITLYTINITIIARMENRPEMGARQYLAFLMHLVLIPILWDFGTLERTWAILYAVFFIYWNGLAIYSLTRTPPRTVNAILKWLSGFCLIDAIYLVLFGQAGLSIVAALCFFLTVRGHRRILGT